MWNVCLCASEQWEVGERGCGICESAGHPGKEAMWCMHVCEHREARERGCSCACVCRETEERGHIRYVNVKARRLGKESCGVCVNAGRPENEGMGCLFVIWLHVTCILVV